MNREELSAWITSQGRIQFSRSSGPGGQNVNKVNTRVTLRLPVAEIPLLPKEMELLRERLKNRITSEGFIVLNCGATRSQSQNRFKAENRALELICRALKELPKREKTKPGKAAVEKRLSEKKLKAGIKKTRRGLKNSEDE